jgi:hypothetical protein
VAVNVTNHVPARKVLIGFRCVDVVPSENVHNQDVGTPVVVSINCTVSGAGPEKVFASKLATGATVGIPIPVMTTR